MEVYPSKYLEKEVYSSVLGAWVAGGVGLFLLLLLLFDVVWFFCGVVRLFGEEMNSGFL